MYSLQIATLFTLGLLDVEFVQIKKTLSKLSSFFQNRVLRMQKVVKCLHRLAV